MSSNELQSLARLFASEVTDLLNGTVTDGVRLSAVQEPSCSNSWAVAPGISRKAWKRHYLPLKVDRRAPTGHLVVEFRTRLDDENRYLAVESSTFGLYLHADNQQMLLHYDYIRDPDNPYPVAHVQVDGQSPVLVTWRHNSGRPPRELERLHLPVGGRRFRPALEDVIEFLIIEGLARPRHDWDKVIAEHRDRWTNRQLRAAVRRSPEAAAAELADAGYRVMPP